MLAVGLALGICADPATAGAAPVPVQTFTPRLTVVGTVNLSTLAGGGAAAKTATNSALRYRAVDNQVIRHRPRAGTGRALSPALSRNLADTVSPQNVPGETGFVGITGYDQAYANGGLDLEPPDQGLCAGQGVVGEFVNNAFSVYQPDGAHLLPVIPSYEIFKQPSTAFLSDPRCHYDAATQRWFLTEFVVGTATAPSTQYIAVSNTADPTGAYTIWAMDTTDRGTANCPCFGDYDVLGMDNNGVYIATDEFGNVNFAYNGVIIYALSKQTLENFSTTGIPPVPVAYRLTKDPFGQPYLVSPTETPPGAAFAPNTEYFVESNGNAFSDNRLVVYALRDTSVLAAPGTPSLYRTGVHTEPYQVPPPAKQKPGPIPLGNASQAPEGVLQADFDAVMQTTYVGGHIYAELDTGTTGGTSQAAWFSLTPKFSRDALTATVAHQGYVNVAGASLLYPAIGVDFTGRGYMVFSLSGRAYYPSAAYIAFAPTGTTGPVRIAQPGAAPEDGFTCYAAFVGPNYGGCRWGDYSSAVAMGHQIFMATEMIPPSSRDILTNWGTYVWNAPAP